MDFILSLTSILLPSCVTTGINLNGKLMFSLILYYIRSNVPSGGVNVIDLSLSNFGSLTH
jgi:hypothetical protein